MSIPLIKMKQIFKSHLISWKNVLTLQGYISHMSDLFIDMGTKKVLGNINGYIV